MKEEMDTLGVTKTVYGYLYPEVKDVMRSVFTDPELIEIQERNYTGRQDGMGESFVQRFRDWSHDILHIDAERFKYVYPAAGSAESIREAIAVQASDTYAKGKKPELHMFEGDYEGYVAYANAHHVNVKTHKRKDYASSLQDTSAESASFYLSQPSGIDGNVWKEYDTFLEWLAVHKPSMDVFVDLAYMGTVASAYRISTHHKNIRSLFFSLSKAYGVFYQRIGGMISDREWPSLYANRLWFKNLVNLKLGESLMQEFPVQSLPQKYQPVQREVITDLNAQLHTTIEPSDSIIIATQASVEPLQPVQQALRRTENTIRYCLTPAIDRRVSSHEL